MARADTGDGFTVLDGATLVMGSAIASVHILRIIRNGLTGVGMIMVSITFSWVAVTAAGPFILLARRYARRLTDSPKTGDWLWALLGLPWLITALLQSAMPGEDPRQSPLLAGILSVGLGLACVIALFVVWGAWVVVPPEKAAHLEAAPWTNRVGLILAIAWPIQCGLGMVVLG
jgi:hypothetical protein